VISPLLSNLYLTEVDRMLERAKEATRYGKYTGVEYARFVFAVLRPKSPASLSPQNSASRPVEPQALSAYISIAPLTAGHPPAIGRRRGRPALAGERRPSGSPCRIRIGQSPFKRRDSTHSE